ncbi:NPCBM/NEW2 domain-containing protein [Sphingobacterium sp.]|uniref:NPCBM/NEW2 domain-containing protein n=1 Tax=Sphingobacterium sp. TaxID=341027 RepID=UPI0031E26BA6
MKLYWVRTRWVILLLLLWNGLNAQTEIALNKLDMSNAWQEYGSLQVDKAVNGEIAKVNNKSYENVLGVHARSMIKIQLSGEAAQFKTWVGVSDYYKQYNTASVSTIPLVDGKKMYFDVKNGKKQFVGLADKDGQIAKASVSFIVIGDGKELFKSQIVKTGDEPLKIDIPVKGVQLLELIVDPTANGASGDGALWINPIIVYPKNLYASYTPKVVEANYVGSGRKVETKVEQRLKGKISQLSTFEGNRSGKTPFDWLLTPERSKAKIWASEDGKDIIIGNSMLSRRFRILPNLATIELTNRMLGEEMLRAVSSEGSIIIDGKKWTVGGLDGQPERGYLKSAWVDNMKSLQQSFLVEDFEIRDLSNRINWKPKRWALNDKMPSGKEIVFKLRGDRELKDVIIHLIYAVYDNIPVISKRMEIINNGKESIDVNSYQLEYLAFADPESPGGGDPSKFRLPNIHIESDLAAGGGFTEKETDITEKWVTDPAYTSQRNYLLQTPCILNVSPEAGPDQTILPGKTFSSFTVYEMPFDSDDRERKGLFTRKMYRTIAPWTTENPIFMHLTSTDPRVVHEAIDQCDSTGYEMVILSFGSGLNVEDTTAANIQKFRGFVEYARSKGIDMGCYSLLASRWISDTVDIINPETGKRGGMTFGSSPCLASEWGYQYFEKVKYFFEKTGMKCFEHDGSYPGDFCASTTHAHHKGFADSQWAQFEKITTLYHWMSENGIYMNVPDFYFLNGSNKVGIGYREVNWSLPRDRQLIHARQLNYDCTWDRIPSSLWSFVPLVEYQGGGEAATLEPLNSHLYEYEMHMVQNYSAGIQACYRGPRLYDTPKTKQLVVEVIDWYKRYRNILNSDIIHLRKPDAKDWDGIMHVDPQGKEKALAMFFNPTDRAIERIVRLPLYYTGLTEIASVREKEGEKSTYKLNRDYSAEIKISIPANGYTWYVVE